MQLLTPRSAVKMQKSANMFMELCSTLDLDDEETALEFIKQHLLPSSDESNPRGFGFVEEFDVLTEREAGMTDDDFRKYCRAIGKAGEKFVFETLTKQFIEQAYTVTSKTETEVVLLDTANQKRAVVSLGDCGNYTQRGWDVCVKLTENQQEKCEFYEVKTHTISSAARGIVMLSPAQMKCAMNHKDKFYIALVSCDGRTLECKDMQLYTDVPELIGNGKFVSDNTLSFFIK